MNASSMIVLFLVQLISTTIIGGSVGLLLGRLASYRQSRNVVGSLIRFLRYAQWFPHIVTWGLPIWPPRGTEDLPGIALIWIIASAAVALAAIYRYLILRHVLQLTGSAFWRALIREVLLRGLLICLLSQLWLQPYGWRWYALVDPDWRLEILQNFFFLTGIVLAINILTRADFVEIVERAHRSMENQFPLLTRLTLWGSFLILGLGVLTWHLFSGFFDGLFSMPSVVDLIRTGVMLATNDVLGTSHPAAYHLAISLGEIILGVGLANGVALVVTNCMREPVNTFVNHLLLATYVVPILLSLLAIS